jgi:hypothetical protein
MTSLRSQQSKSYFTEATPQSVFRKEFGLPDNEVPLAEVYAVLSLQGKDEAFVSRSS